MGNIELMGKGNKIKIRKMLNRIINKIIFQAKIEK
jgi:hypothetical protein